MRYLGGPWDGNEVPAQWRDRAVILVPFAPPPLTARPLPVPFDLALQKPTFERGEYRQYELVGRGWTFVWQDVRVR